MHFSRIAFTSSLKAHESVREKVTRSRDGYAKQSKDSRMIPRNTKPIATACSLLGITIPYASKALQVFLQVLIKTIGCQVFDQFAERSRGRLVGAE
jgi:hypothetical protein